MQEKKFKVQPKINMKNFESSSEYWVYSVESENEEIKFLIYNEIDKSWAFYDAALFFPVKEKSAEELLLDFQKSMANSKE